MVICAALAAGFAANAAWGRGCSWGWDMNIYKGAVFMDFLGKQKKSLSTDRGKNSGKPWGIRYQLIALFLAMAFVPLLIMGFFIDRNIRNNAEQEFVSTTAREINQVDNATTIFFDGMKQNLKLLADGQSIRQNEGSLTVYIDKPAGADGMVPMKPLEAGGYEASLYTAFEAMAKAHPAVSVISFGTADGGYMQYPAVPRKTGYDSRSRDWYKDTVQDPDKLLLADPFLTSKGVPTIGIFTTVRDQQNQIKGVLGFNIDLPVITQLLQSIKLGNTGYAILLDSKDTVIADPKHPEMNFKKIQEEGSGAFSDINALAGASREISIDGSKKLVTAIVSPVTGWKYVCLVDADEVFAGSAALRQALVLGMLVIMLLVVFVSGIAAGKIATPLQHMVESCKEMAAGDFRDKSGHSHGEDEIGQLGKALEDMRRSLRTAFKQVNESSEQVAASAEQLTASAEQSSLAVTQVAESINDVAQGAAKQLKAVDETSLVVETMSKGIEEAASGSNRVAADSEQAAVKAQEGNAAVVKAVNQMAHIAQTVNNSALVVDKLGERSKEVGQIVDVIAGIAGQTNLLALNAAIEAARAGEQGRGFAVVAEEVRKLAEQSQDAAKQIAGLIGEIQGDTEQAVVAMNEGTREVSVGTDVVTAAGTAFEEIAGLITRVSDQVKGISGTMQQLASGSQRIVASVQTIDGQNKLAVDEAQTVSAATEEQSAAMEEIASSSHSLAKLAETLQTAVNRFKI